MRLQALIREMFHKIWKHANKCCFQCRYCVTLRHSGFSQYLTEHTMSHCQASDTEYPIPQIIGRVTVSFTLCMHCGQVWGCSAGVAITSGCCKVSFSSTAYFVYSEVMLHWLVQCFLVWGTLEGFSTVRRTPGPMYLSLDQFSYIHARPRVGLCYAFRPQRR